MLKSAVRLKSSPSTKDTAQWLFFLIFSHDKYTLWDFIYLMYHCSILLEQWLTLVQLRYNFTFQKHLSERA